MSPRAEGLALISVGEGARVTRTRSGEYGDKIRLLARGQKLDLGRARPRGKRKIWRVDGNFLKLLSSLKKIMYTYLNLGRKFQMSIEFVFAPQ